MKKTRILALVCAMLLLFSYAYAENQAPDLTTLTTWEGTWVDFASFFQNEEIKVELEKLAKEHNKNVEEVLAPTLAMMKNDIFKLSVEGNSISFFDVDGKELEKNEYTFSSLIKDKFGDFEFEWALYVSDNKEAKFPVLLLIAPHSDGEDTVLHFHARYGNHGGELMEKKDWYPTFVKEDTTVESFKGELAELFSK